MIFNWNDISWIFNYREVYGLLDDFFNPYPSENIATANAPNVASYYPNSQAQKTAIKFEYSEKNNLLEIPAINISAPIIFSQTADSKIILKDLDKGVVFYPGSVLPAQPGQAVILWHSAPPNWPKIKHDWVFTNLNNLKPGDKIYIYIDYKKYAYTVGLKSIIKKGQEIIPMRVDQGNYLALVSCWPPGKDYQRISVQAKLD